MTAAERRFIAGLDRWRREEHLGHNEFAEEKLALDRSHWYLLRHGQRRLSMTLYWHVVAQRPQLSAHLVTPVAVDHPASDACRAAFAAYLLRLAEAEEELPLSPADLKRCWRTWEAAWHASRAEDTKEP